jgi:trehalose 6-phosphate phosphatase
VRAILSEADAGAPVAYLGDDATDEAAFRAINCFGPHILSVLMRRQWHKTEADIWLRPPVELRGFLEDWFRVLEACR